MRRGTCRMTKLQGRHSCSLWDSFMASCLLVYKSARPKKNPPKRRAASKPDSVPRRRSGRSGHSSKQSTRSLMRTVRHTAGGAPRSTSYSILLRGGLALRRRSRAHPGGPLPRLFTIAAPLRAAAVSFSVALSVARLVAAPSALDERILCPAESGLSSAFWPRPVTRAPLQEKSSEARVNRGKACARTSCRPRRPAAARLRRCACSRPRAGSRSAAAPDGIRRRRRIA